MVMFLQKPLVESVHSEQTNPLTMVGQKHFTVLSVSSLVFLTWTLSGRPCHVDIASMSGSELTPQIHGHECFLYRLTQKEIHRQKKKKKTVRLHSVGVVHRHHTALLWHGPQMESKSSTLFRSLPGQVVYVLSYLLCKSLKGSLL